MSSRRTTGSSSAVRARTLSASTSPPTAKPVSSPSRFAEALPNLRHSLELDPRNFILQWTIGYAYAAVGRLDEAIRHAAVLNQMGPDVPYTRQLLALLDVLEQAVDQGFYPYPFIAEHCPFLAPLRPLPRFAGILAKAKERSETFGKSEYTAAPSPKPPGDAR